nr:immunoglobulin light chain junction region [Macaca mulatta]
RHHTYGTPFTF